MLCHVGSFSKKGPLTDNALQANREFLHNNRGETVTLGRWGIHGKWFSKPKKQHEP